jgi:hypothetical protein
MRQLKLPRLTNDSPYQIAAPARREIADKLRHSHLRELIRESAPSSLKVNTLTSEPHTAEHRAHRVRSS